MMTMRKIELSGGEGTGEQLTFTTIELGDTVRRIAAIEFKKKDANDDWNAELKVLKKRMYALAEALPGGEERSAKDAEKRRDAT